MTGDSAPRLWVSPRTCLLGGLAAVLVLAIAGVVAPGPVLHGWLIAFVSVGGIAFGALAWLAIHALTGGRWGEVARPQMLAAASAVPMLLVAGLPLMALARLLYPWATDPGSAGPGVASLYLNVGLMTLRGVVLIGILSAFAMLARRGPLKRLAAGLCLVIYAVGMDLSAVDWILSLDPRFTSSAFGMQLIVQQLASALAIVILTSAAPASDKAWGDFGALLFATVLGEGYLVLFTFLVEWYGDLPDQAQYYLQRSLHGWWVVEVAGTLLGCVAPLIALMYARIRHDRSALRLVAGAVLAGIVVEDIWLIAPHAGDLLGSGGGAALAGVLSVIALLALGWSATRRLTAKTSDSHAQRSVAHGL